ARRKTLLQVESFWIPFRSAGQPVVPLAHQPIDAAQRQGSGGESQQFVRSDFVQVEAMSLRARASSAMSSTTLIWMTLCSRVTTYWRVWLNSSAIRSVKISPNTD